MTGWSWSFLCIHSHPNLKNQQKQEAKTEAEGQRYHFKNTFFFFFTEAASWVYLLYLLMASTRSTWCSAEQCCNVAATELSALRTHTVQKQLKQSLHTKNNKKIKQPMLKEEYQRNKKKSIHFSNDSLKKVIVVIKVVIFCCWNLKAESPLRLH